MSVLSDRTLNKIIAQYLSNPVGKRAVHFLFGLGASYIMYIAMTKARCKVAAAQDEEQVQEDPRVRDLKKSIENLQGSNRKNSDQLCEIARVLETVAAEYPVSLGPGHVQMLAESLMESEVEVRIKCYHALQCVLQYGADTTEAVTALQLYVPLMLCLVSIGVSVEEQEACLRLLVSLSSCRVAHTSVAKGLPALNSLTAKRILYPEILILVVRILHNLSDNEELVDKLFYFNAQPALLRLLQPSNPKDTLLLCLGLLSNLSQHRPAGGDNDQRIHEESLLALLYFPASPLRSTLTTLCRHRDPLVSSYASRMLSSMPRAITLPRPSRLLRRGRARPGVLPSF
ncbi:hypothetical protein ACEWY4_000207 [Coilia grayii]|uniref:Armadillo repeat-containing domain-containing protein n=1 Tax=Coilia grayii TaxID=363190 RepID=A0ABD1KW08_9TELE